MPLRTCHVERYGYLGDKRESVYDRKGLRCNPYHRCPGSLIGP